jgi:hypothetical protein
MSAAQAASPTQITLTLAEEEREPLLRILEQVLRGKRVEVHRTEAPAYREYVLREEALLDRLVEQLRRP